MSPNFYVFTAILLLALSSIPLNAQESCGAGGSPFLLSASETICAGEDGLTEIIFTVANLNDPGTYEIKFPDGVDTVLTDITGSVNISHYFRFICDSLPGNPNRPRAGSLYFGYRNALTVTRTDCLDNLGQRSSGSYDFNIVPNPVVDIDVTDVNCSQPPYLVSFEADICSELLVSGYQWFVDGNRIEGANEKEISNRLFTRAGPHTVRLVVTDPSGCGNFEFEKEFNISPSPVIDVEFTVDSTQLCSPTVTVTTSTEFKNADTFLWTSDSPDVSFSDSSASSPTIFIQNDVARTRIITVTASNEDCPEVSQDFELTTYDGQTITTTEPIVTCTDIATSFCDFINYVPEPQTINWTSADASVTVTEAESLCPQVTFQQPGTYQLTASGLDICNNPYTATISIRVQENIALGIDRTALDTLCETNGVINLRDFVTPAANLAAVSGPGVSGFNFDPAGLSGPTALQLTDSCTNVYDLDIFVLTEGGFGGGNPVICLGESLDLAAIQPGTYSGPGVSGNVFRSDDTGLGTYTIDYTSTAFCGGTGRFTIEVAEFPEASFSIFTEGCQGGAAGALYAGNAPVTLRNESTATVTSYTVLETGDQIVGQDDVDFMFPADGTYTIRQVVSFPGGTCSDSTELTIEIANPFDASYSVAIDSSACDSLTLSFYQSGVPANASLNWLFTTGDQSDEPAPVLTLARPYTDENFNAVVEADNGCFTQTDTLTVKLPLRFQVSFDILNDNNTVCSDDTIYLVNTSTNAATTLVTFPDGTTATSLPPTLVVSNPGQEAIQYIIELMGTNADCPSQTVVDTLTVLPVTTEAAFSLTFDGSCSPLEVSLKNSSTPGSRSLVYWGDAATPQLVGDLEEIVHTYTVSRDTSFNIRLVAQQCGIDSYSRTLEVDAAPPAAFQVYNSGADCVDQEMVFRPDNDLTGLSLEWEFGDGQVSIDAVPRYAYSQAGSYRPVLTVTDPNGCTSTDSARVNITSYNGPPLMVDIPATLCVDAPLSLQLNGFGDNISYDYGNGLMSSTAVQRPYQEEGDYLLSVISTDANGCSIDTTDLISVFPRFTASIMPDLPDTSINFGEELSLSFQISPLRNLTSIVWIGDSIRNPSVQTTSAFPLKDGIYRLMVTDEYGCLSEDSIQVMVAKEYNEVIFAPNAFSPNGDGTNDAFGLQAKPATVANMRSFRVFSRWGAMVYECTDCMPGAMDQRWDGRLNGNPVKPGVYIWSAEIDFVDGSSQVFRGDVILLR